MWCNCDATVPPRFVHSSPCQVCSSLLSVGSEVQFPVTWMRLVAIHQAALRIRRVRSNHVSGILREHIAIHSHFNKSLDHISVYSSQFVFSILQSTLTRLCLPFNQKMHLLHRETAPVVPVQLPCTQRSINSTKNKNNPIFFYSLLFCGRCFHIYRIFPSNLSSLVYLS